MHFFFVVLSYPARSTKEVKKNVEPVKKSMSYDSILF